MSSFDARQGVCSAQWAPDEQRLAILPRGQAFALVYDAAERELCRVPVCRSVRPTLCGGHALCMADQHAQSVNGWPLMLWNVSAPLQNLSAAGVACAHAPK